MKKFHTVFDTLHLEVRYTDGYLYFDRCGQSLIDIERECEGWLTTSVDHNTGNLECPEKNCSAGFNQSSYAFSINRIFDRNIDDCIDDAITIWKIIQVNFGLRNFKRIGCRTNYYLPTESTEDSEKIIDKMEIKLCIPKNLKETGYNLKSRQLIFVLEKDFLEYRIELASVIRHDAISPGNIIKSEPRFLSKKQNEFRIAKLRQLSQYSANPMYAVNFDIDSSKLDPEHVDLGNYIIDSRNVVQKDFLPLLENL